jgi:hypothetical protein
MRTRRVGAVDAEAQPAFSTVHVVEGPGLVLDPVEDAVHVDDVETDWYTTTYWPSVRPLVVQLLRTPANQRDPKVLEASGRAAAAAATIHDP